MLHYGQEIFEGMKAYPRRGWRSYAVPPARECAPLPGVCQARSHAGVARIPLPGSDRAVGAGRPELGAARVGNLYLRPFMFANEVFLGIKPASEFIFCVIACPVGPYFLGGDKAVSVWVSENYARRARRRGKVRR
ncbi:hypothetical protein ACU4GD_01490 [Cupriavidus basilensis]